MEEKQITNPVKAIRAKCLDCCCGSPEEVRQCPCENCALYPFRLGKNPYRAKREYTAEELEKKRQIMARANAAKLSINSREKNA